MGEFFMHNRAFWRAMHSLVHPITLAAIILLLLNDHYLKQNHPSGWTGKLSDIAGLIFAPIICTAVLACLIPPSNHLQEKFVAIVAFTLTGSIFALSNLLPIANRLTEQVWAFFAGANVQMWQDSSDLLTLPALLIGWHIWQHADNHPPKVTVPSWLVLIVGSLAAVATSPGAIDYGIICIAYQNGTLIAGHGLDDKYDEIDGAFEYFLSSNLGQTWRRHDKSYVEHEYFNTPQAPPTSFDCTRKDETWDIVNLHNRAEIYRIKANTFILRSKDSGQSWKSAVDLRWIVSHQRQVQLGRAPGGILPSFGDKGVPPGPVDATFVPESDELYVAMGLDGLLTLSADGKTRWITIDEYGLEGISSINIRLMDLWPQFLMAVAAALLTFTFVAQPILRSCLCVAVTVPAWIIWVIALIQIDLTTTPSANLKFSVGVVGLFFMYAFVFPGMALLWIMFVENREIFRDFAKLISVATIAGFCAALAPFVSWQMTNLNDPNAYDDAVSTAIKLVSVIQLVGFALIWYLSARSKRHIDIAQLNH